MAETMNTFRVVALRGVQYRKSPVFADVAHEGPDLGATLEGELVEGEGGVNFLHVDPKSDQKLQKILAQRQMRTYDDLYLPTTTPDGAYVLVTNKKPEIFEVIAFQGVRLRNSPTYEDKVDGAGPVMGDQIAGSVVTGLDKEQIQYLQIFKTGHFVPLTNLSKDVNVLSRVIENDDIEAMCSDVWAELESIQAEMDFSSVPKAKDPARPKTPPEAEETSQPTSSALESGTMQLKDLEEEHAQLLADSQSVAEALKDAKLQLQCLQESNAALEAQVAADKASCAEAEEVSDKAGQVALDLQEDLDEATDELEELEEEVEALKEEVQQKKDELATLKG